MDEQKVFIVIQLDNIDGEYFVNAIPCATLDVAKMVMQSMIDAVLENPQYKGLDLKEVSPEFYAEVSDTRVKFGCVNDDYDECFKITEKEILGL